MIALLIVLAACLFVAIAAICIICKALQIIINANKVYEQENNYLRSQFNFKGDASGDPDAEGLPD